MISCFLFLSVVGSYAGRKIVVPHDFPSIHAALGEADEGDTVFVSKGTYRENIAMQDNVVLMGQDMLRTVIDGGRIGPCVIGADGGNHHQFHHYQRNHGHIVQKYASDNHQKFNR